MSRAGPRTPPKATGRDKGKGRARDAAEPEGYYKGEPNEEQIAQVERELTFGIGCGVRARNQGRDSPRHFEDTH